jgi:hypothetical protein
MAPLRLGRHQFSEVSTMQMRRVILWALLIPFLLGSDCPGGEGVLAIVPNFFAVEILPVGDGTPAHTVVQGGQVELTVRVDNGVDIETILELSLSVPPGVTATFENGSARIGPSIDENVIITDEHRESRTYFAPEETKEFPVTIKVPGDYPLGTFVVTVNAHGFAFNSSDWALDDQRATAQVNVMPVVFEDVFDDEEPPETRWTKIVAAATGGATDSLSNSASGGESGGFRYMEHRFPDAGHINVRHFYTGGTYDPGTQGAIDSITYSEDRIQFDPPFSGAAIGTGFILEQGGNFYYKLITEGTFTSDVWERVELTGLTPADFSPEPGPDFSDQGQEIRFGYFRSNTSNGGALTTKHGIDNWRVEIHKQ